MSCDGAGGGLDADGRQAGIGHPAYRGAADDGRDADDGLRADSIGDPWYREDDPDADDRVRRRQQDEVSLVDRRENSGSRRSRVRAYSVEVQRRNLRVKPDPPLLEVDRAPAVLVIDQ